MSDLIERLRGRTLAKHGGPSRPLDGWNLSDLDSELHVEAATEIETLRALLAHWKTFAIHAEGEHAAWKKTATELDDELRALRDPAPLMAWITQGGCECLQRGEGPVRVMPEENHETGFTVPLYARERPVDEDLKEAAAKLDRLEDWLADRASLLLHIDDVRKMLA